jgi:CysZ protein
MLKGLQDYAGSIELISRLGLWKYFSIPIIISVLVASIIGFSAYGFSDDIGVWVSGVWSWDWGKSAFTTFSTIISAVIIIAIGLILFKHIIMALSAPFMSPVSEKIESHLLRGNSHVSTSRNSSFMATVAGEAVRINGTKSHHGAYLLPFLILLLKFIPVVNIFSTVLLFLLQAYYAGFGNMDYTLERHFSYRESIKFVRQNKGIAIGNGTGFLLLLLIPVVGVLMVLPFSVTAASVSTVRKLNAGRASQRIT